MRVIALAWLVAAIAVGAAHAALPGHALLVDRGGLRVYGPAQHAGAPCPRLLTPPRNAQPIVQRAVRLAMVPFERQLGLNGRDARVLVGKAGSMVFSPAAGGCGDAAWRRSLIASVQLPHVGGAALAQHTFAVGRVRDGWVLWAWIQ